MGKGNHHNRPLGCWEQLYLQLKELFLSAYEWENLPETVNERYLNLMLFEQGRVVFFEDTVLNEFYALQGTMEGQHDIYREPVKMRVLGGSGYTNLLRNHSECVVIYHNQVRTVPRIRLMDFAKRIDHIEKTIDINVNAQKTPYFVGTNQQQKLTAVNILSQMDDYKPAVLVNENLDLDKLIAIPTIAPLVAPDLQKLKRDIWNEALAYIGIESNMSEKNERLVVGEVVVSNGLPIANRNAMLKTRMTGVNEINKLFGLSVGVKATNPSVLDEIVAPEQIEEGEMNG